LIILSLQAVPVVVVIRVVVAVLVGTKQVQLLYLKQLILLL
jgi:hypothetical protein